MYEHVSKKTPRFLFVSLPCRISLPWVACHHLLPSFLLPSRVLDKATFIAVTSTVQKRRAVWGGLDLQSTLGGVSELGVDGWLWVRLDGEFPNSKSAGLVKSLTDWSQRKRCKDVFVDVFVDPQSNELIDPIAHMVVFKNTHGLPVPSKKKTPGSSMRHSCASFA